MAGFNVDTDEGGVLLAFGDGASIDEWTGELTVRMSASDALGLRDGLTALLAEYEDAQAIGRGGWLAGFRGPEI